MSIFAKQDWHHADEEHSIYYEARRAHAWRMRSLGFTLERIGDRIGVSRERARQMISYHARWLRPRQQLPAGSWPYWPWEGKN